MFNIVKNGNHAQYGTVEYIADLVSDIESAPIDCAPGSKLFCIENSNTYILSSEKTWVVYSKAGQVPTGGGMDKENVINLLEGTNIPTLDTENKTIAGSINELNLIQVQDASNKSQTLWNDEDPEAYSEVKYPSNKAVIDYVTEKENDIKTAYKNADKSIETKLTEAVKTKPNDNLLFNSYFKLISKLPEGYEINNMTLYPGEGLGIDNPSDFSLRANIPLESLGRLSAGAIELTLRIELDNGESYTKKYTDFRQFLRPTHITKNVYVFGDIEKNQFVFYSGDESSKIEQGTCIVSIGLFVEQYPASSLTYTKFSPFSVFHDITIDNYIEGKILDNNTTHYNTEPTPVGFWINGDSIVKQTFKITEGLAKDNLIKVADLPSGFKMLIKSEGIIKTTEGSYSNNDILIYSSTSGIYCKQNFTSYPTELYITVEYTV